MIVMPKRQPLIKEVNQDCALEVISSNAAYNPGFGFLHIPKTGGSSFMSFLERNHGKLTTMPVPLFHTWTLPLVAQYFPAMKLIFMLRDPLERTISGYQSRLRMGLPEYHVPWRNEEAIAFCMYPSVKEFLDALLDESDYHVSATEFLLNSVSAISWNYSYYFNSPQTIEELSAQLGPIAKLENFNDLIEHLFTTGILHTSEDEDEKQEILKGLSQAHRSEKQSKSFLGDYSENEIAKMRARLQNEYIIYDALEPYCNI